MSNNWRQHLHLEPKKGWLNDPNGLCWFQGNYHVYFQYCPTSAQGKGLKCWGHFSSPDFIHWKLCSPALHPDIPEDRDGVYSGCAVVLQDVLRLFYTGNVKEPGNYDYITAGRGANVIGVITLDGFTMSQKQVLLRNCDYPAFCSNHVRDPKVWHQDGGWYMVLGERSLEGKGGVLVYTSQDLVHWQYTALLTTPKPFGYMWECPDYYCLDGKGILSVSPQGLEHCSHRYQNVYQSGWFEVQGSITDAILGDFTEWDMGFDFYAPQSFLTPDGRRVMIGWMGLPDIEYCNPTVVFGWQHCLTLPREIFWDSCNRLCQQPIGELEKLRVHPTALHSGDILQVQLPFELCGQTHQSFCLELASGLRLCYDENKQEASLEFTDTTLGCGRTKRLAKLQHCSNLRILADMSSLEIYLDGGSCVFTTRFYPRGSMVLLTLQGFDAVLWQMKHLEVEVIDTKNTAGNWRSTH
ncbi:MAG: glycoside hydrolase family 32 protein [Angelakisella sp.]|nr:glycoside hydrolase family 32 protein [Angelakisella sp.]